MRLLVTIPLCDYEPIATRHWLRSTTHFIVARCLRSFCRNTQVPLDLHVLADRCSPRFVAMAERALAPLRPQVSDNSELDPRLAEARLSEKLKHVANQFLRTMELGADHDVVYFCEQDYLFKKDAVLHGLTAFEEITKANVVSLFDHPDRHDPERELEHGRHTIYPTRRSTWKSVSSTNGNLMWRGSFLRERREWILERFLDGGMDHRISRDLYHEGELLLSPVASLIQHFRLDGSNASPTFGPSFWMATIPPAFRLVLRSRRLRQRLGIRREL